MRRKKTIRFNNVDKIVCTLQAHNYISLLQISGFVLDENFQQKASKFAIFYIGIQKPKVAFTVFHFMLLNECPCLC